MTTERSVLRETSGKMVNVWLMRMKMMVEVDNLMRR